MIEEGIRKQQVKNMKKQKWELEQKLLSLNENLVNLSYPSQRSIRAKELTREEKQKQKEEAEQKRKNAEDFIQQINAKEKERKKKTEEKLKTLKEKEDKKLKEFEEDMKRRYEETIKKRKEEDKKTYNNIRKKREEDTKRLEMAKSQSSPPPENCYLYKKLEEKYSNEVLLPGLENRKKELAMKRGQLKTVTQEELNEHIKKYDDYLLRKEEERKNQLRIKLIAEQERKESLDKYKTHMLENECLEEEKRKELKEQKARERMEFMKKRMDYANLIPDIHPVTVSEKKAQDLKWKIESLTTKPRISKSKLVTNLSTNKPPGSLRRISNPKSNSSANNELITNTAKIKKNKFTKDTMSERRNLSDNANELDEENNKSKPKLKRQTEVRKNPKEEKKSKLGAYNKYSQEISEKPKRINKVKDPLEELKQKRGDQYGKHNKNSYDWNKDLINDKLDHKEKLNRITGKAHLIEQKAIRKEELMKGSKGVEGNIELGEEVSDMYLDAIKAKLAILANLEQN